MDVVLLPALLLESLSIIAANVLSVVRVVIDKVDMRTSGVWPVMVDSGDTLLIEQPFLHTCAHEQAHINTFFLKPLPHVSMRRPPN